MMLSKKNSETLENFSEKLEVEGRSLWQDARRRFMHNRAAVASLIVLVLIALFVILAPMLSQFAYDDTDWAMMSSAPDMESGHYFGTDSSGRDLLVRVAIGGRISLMVGVAAALVAVVVGTLYGSLSGYLGGKVDSVMMRLLEILNKITSGNGELEDIDKLEELCYYIKENSLCGLGQTAPNPVLSTLKYYRDEYEAHVVEHRCPAGACKALTNYSIIADKCKGCTLCARNCPVGAISGSVKQPHVIDTTKCIKCGVCMEKCKFGAVVRK